MPMESTALGEVFLMANDHMHAEFSESARDDEDQFGRMAVHVGPVQEAAEDRVRHKMIRSHTMLTETLEQLRGEQPFFDVPQLFEAATAIHLPRFYALLIGALSRFANFDPQSYMKDPSNYSLREQWFASTKIPEPEIMTFLNYISAIVPISR